VEIVPTTHLIKFKMIIESMELAIKESVKKQQANDDDSDLEEDSNEPYESTIVKKLTKEPDISALIEKVRKKLIKVR